MTRTGPANGTSSWETASVAPDDGSRIDSVVSHDAARPRGRIRRSMTACNTCRKLKTRCDLDPRGHACRRCLSLRLDCELPETPERFQDSASIWSDANAAIPSIEERLVSLERGMGEMINLMRQIVNQSPNLSSSPTSQLLRNNSIDDTSSCDSGLTSLFTLKPAQLIQDLQAECFGERNHFSTDADLLGDLVTQGVVDYKFSLKLIELFEEYFGPWVSINHASSLQPTNTLLFNTACLLASRYLPGIPPQTVRDISLRVQHAVAKTLWKPPPLTTDMLQALTLLCLYSTSVHKEGPMDGWLLSGISVNHALLSFGFLNIAPTELVMTEKVVAQLRLWNTLCLTHLHSALGNGRAINIQPQYLDHCPRILDHAGATQEDGKIVAEIQLHRIMSKLQNSQQRLQFGEAEYEEIERWKMEWAHLLTNDEQPTLELSLWFCQLLLQRTATRLQPDSDRLEPEICSNARLIITKFLQTRFSAAPGLIDHVYFMVCYAALTLCDYNLSDPLIDQVRAFLLQLAPGGDHLAYRIACIVTEVQRRYSEATAVHASSPTTEVPKNSLFATSHQNQHQHHNPRATSLDMAQLMPTAGVMDTLIDGYGCLDQLLPGYVSPQPAFEAPSLFQQHPVPVTGGAMPIGLVPRALHDW
ncbi:hypothetical protein NUU61_002616 [Penicillium alfredii]|uniref:Transcriptional activator of proteases prtT n=1 Tax=Penicillium alfredii TaxID=1506179 RepID=A0A9W9KG50_9EURO|nr:uncharacterized protein NUU61_002616 [Penicillium alfredii]KAJ5105269.1 hypothetical protein NUU61_002616 [Penicillium alfredii]